MWDQLELDQLNKLFKNEPTLHELLSEEEIRAISYDDKMSITLANLKSGLKYSNQILKPTRVRCSYERLSHYY